MWGADHSFLYDPHIEKLSVIKGVTFTPREIDIISCLMHMRGPSKISVLLSISSHTAVAHIRNIMLKIGCSSKENIIDFIEQSPKLPIINKHYTQLVLRATFEKILKDIAAIKRKPIQAHLVVFPEKSIENNSFIFQLEKHLKQAGVDSIIEVVTNRNEEIEAHSSDKSTHFLVLSERDKVPKDFLKYDFLDFSQHKTDYFLVFEILTKLLHPINLTGHIQNFHDQYIGMTNASINNEPSMFRNMMMYRRKLDKKWAFSLIIFSFVFIFFSSIVIYYSSFFFKESQKIPLTKDQKQAQFQEASIRPDLPVPTRSILLERSDELSQIDKKLEGESGIQTVALVGPGGIGKTILGRQYVHQQNAKIIWEINAETKESLKSSFESLGRALAQTEEDKKILRSLQEVRDPIEKEELLIQFVKDRLKAHSSWFLIYDNVEKFIDIKNFFPRDSKTWGEGKIILTTRDSNIQNNDYLNGFIQVKELKPEQKFLLFTRILDNGQRTSLSQQHTEETKKFLEKIPPYPLDVAVAAFYFKTINISYAEYLENLSKNRPAVATIQENLMSATGAYMKTRYGILTLSLQQLIKRKDFRDLLVCMSFLDSQHLPRELLNLYKSRIIVDDFIYNLKKYSLITDEIFHFSLGQTISIHRDTQAITLEYLLSLMKKEERSKVTQSIADTMEKYTDKTIDSEDFSKIQSLVPHCKSLFNHRKLLNNFMQHVIKNDLGVIYYFTGYYQKGKEFLETSIAAFDILKDQNRLIRSFVYLGRIYVESDEKNNIKKLISSMSKIDTNRFGMKDIAAAQISTSLGDMHDSIGNYQKAKELLHKSVVLYQKHQRSPLKLAWTLALLGNVCRKMGNYTEARQYLDESFKTCKGAGAEDHLRVGWVLIHLGNICAALGEYEKARHFTEKGVEFYKKFFPENHPALAWATGYLGNIYIETGNYEEAKNLLQKTLNVYQKNFGENHGGRLRTETDLANAYIVNSL